MKRVNDNEFDDLFKNSLKDAEFDPGYAEDDWDDLERMLDNPKKPGGIVFWLPVLSSAAAILIFLGWWMFRPQVSPMVKPRQPIAVNSTGKTEIPAKGTENAGLAQSTTAKTEQAIPQRVVPQGKPATSLVADDHQKNAAGTKTQPGLVAGTNKIINTKPSDQITDNGINATNATRLASNRQPDNLFTPDAMLALNAASNKNGVADNIDVKPIVHKSYMVNEAPAKQKADRKVSSSVFAQRPQFALTVLGAPEVNGVGSFGDAKAGTNLGLLFSAGIFNKLTISTGATYATMPYNTNIANYHTAYAFKTSPSQIEADCRALDIPVNVDYQLYNKHQNKFSIGTGLSSYIMLHESYDYYYNDPTTKGPAGYTVPNHGKYMFGIANVQATYTRQVNSKFGISVQPYLKLPLTNIGYSQAKLQTAGVAVGLSWNINALTKP